MQSPRRKQPARQEIVEGHNRALIVFLTVATKDRKPILAVDDVHELLQAVWREPASHWAVGRYVILPDHLHLFCSPRRLDSLDVRRWAAYWKSRTTFQWPRPEEKPVWLRDVWDRQLRGGESYEEKWAYVIENQVRHGLVERAADWPFQGEIERLEWHD